jgi:signal transduction histidine kinase
MAYIERNHLRPDRFSNGRLLIVLLFGLLGLISYFLIHSYHQSINQSKDELLSRLMAITKTAALQINGDLHKQLSDNYMQKDAIKTNDENPLYLRLHKVLLSIKGANALTSDIYTIVYYADDSTFHFIGTSAEYPYFRHSYKNYPDALLTQYDIGGTLDVYEDENGIWLSAFAPIRNSKGEIVALVEADEHFETFMQEANNELLQNLLISIVIALPFSLLLLGYVFSSLKKHAEAQEQLINYSEEIKSQNEEIRSQSEQIEQHNQELDKKVKEKTTALIRSNHQLTSFLYHSSHDVQAPIATLKGILNLAEMDITDANARRYISMLRDTTGNLDKMVKTLQIVYDVKSRELLVECVSIKKIVDEIVMLHAHQYPDVKITSEFDDTNSVFTDTGFLNTILSEIIRNAFQYGTSGGKGAIRIKTEYHFGTVNITVEDSGSGIPALSQQVLFTLFSRNHENSKGMGLGLFIAQACAERLGASLSISKSSMGGALFLVRLPL